MKQYIYILLSITLITACKKPYNPPAVNANNNYLVVEGVIDNGPDTTTIKLSRTVNIGAATTVNPELNAVVTVQNDQNASIILKPAANGIYAGIVNLDNARTYRLDVKTSNGKEYASDLVPVKNSPPIDSVSYEYTGSGENIYSSTHDATNNTRYYRWQFSETYLYISPILSNYIYKNKSVVRRTAAENINTCYISNNSSNIILNSSAKLTQDIINRNPITQISFALDKLKIRYSILVKQYALTPAAFDYYTNLAKNTEQLGSIFDAQPSEISGNIHCITTPTEPVLGYVSVGKVVQKRIFIDRSQIPPSIIGVEYNCGTALNTYYGKFRPIPNEIVQGFQIPLDTIQKSYDAQKQDSVFSMPYASPDCAIAR